MESKIKQHKSKWEEIVDLRLKNIKENRQKLWSQPGFSETKPDDLSHDLKTPLHTIFSAVALLKSHLLNTEEQALIQIIENAGQELLQVYDKILAPDSEKGQTEKQEDIIVNKSGTSLPNADINNVLVVDDNRINRIITRNILENQGYHVEVAEDGQQAVEKCLSRTFELILMDIQMPVMDGIEATRILRNKALIGELDYAPFIIALSANTNPKDKNACLSVGMDGFLSKPFEWKKLPVILKSFK